MAVTVRGTVVAIFPANLTPGLHTPRRQPFTVAHKVSPRTAHDNPSSLLPPPHTPTATTDSPRPRRRQSSSTAAAGRVFRLSPSACVCVCERGRALVSVGQTGRVVYCRRSRRFLRLRCAGYSVHRRRFDNDRNKINTDSVRDHVPLI